MNVNRVLLSLISFLFLSSCAKETPADSEIISAPDEHFEYLLYDGLSKEIISTIQKKLNENYDRLLNDLMVEKMDRVKVEIWNDETQFQNVMKRDLGVIYYGSTGYVYGKTAFRILYRGNAPQTALHEFAHVVSLYVNSRIGNNPRWLWEAIALYESGEFINPKSISYLIGGNFPTLEELNSDFNQGNQKIYQVGYLLAEYIVNNFGKEKFVLLIKSNGNVQETLGISTNVFEDGWKKYVTAKYL